MRRRKKTKNFYAASGTSSCRVDAIRLSQGMKRAGQFDPYFVSNRIHKLDIMIQMCYIGYARGFMEKGQKVIF